MRLSVFKREVLCLGVLLVIAALYGFFAPGKEQPELSNAFPTPVKPTPEAVDSSTIKASPLPRPKNHATKMTPEEQKWRREAKRTFKLQY